jgi:sugar lactone lactonase YvrE
MDVSLAFDVRVELGESPVWDPATGRLLFVDIPRGTVHDLDPATAHDVVVDVGAPVGAVALAAGGARIIAAGVGFYRLEPKGNLRVLARVSERADIRMNDGYVDARGRFWAGTMSLVGAAGQGALYRLDPDYSTHLMLEPVTTSNGIDWSPDDRLMYYADTRTGRVDMFDFDLEAGTIGGRRPFAVIPPGQGRPDGLVVDADGAVWVALWAGAAVHRYTPDGALDRVLRLPVTNVTKCAFGGADLGDLFMTTAWSQLRSDESERQPHAGSIFHARPGCYGRPARTFRG